MPLPLTIFSKLKISPGNLKIIVLSGFAIYFLVLYEMFPQFIFDGEIALFTLGIPLVGILVGFNIKKLKLKNLSLKNISVKKSGATTKPTSYSVDSLVSDTGSSEENLSDIDALIAGAEKPEGGSSDIDALIAGAEKPEGGSSDIDALIAGAEKPEGGSSDIDALIAGAEKPEGELSEIDALLANAGSSTPVSENPSMEDASLLIMEKMEPVENDIQTIKTDFDQFKQDLTIVKEEVEILSSSFETTLTDIKLLTTDANNPLNYMKEDSFKKNIQQINVDELVAPEPTPSAPEPTPSAPEPTPSAPEPTPSAPEPITPDVVEVDISNLSEDVISLVDELSQDFESEQVLELTKVHCKTCNISLDENQLVSYLDKKNNSTSLQTKSNLNQLIEEVP